MQPDERQRGSRDAGAPEQDEGEGRGEERNTWYTEA